MNLLDQVSVDPNVCHGKACIKGTNNYNKNFRITVIFKLDENLPVELADLLKSENWEACTVYEEHLSGKPDSTIADICKKEKKVLVSLDLDFSDIRTYPPKEYRLRSPQVWGFGIDRDGNYLDSHKGSFF
ncbi:MAG: DUF5615 family PIN-like protein [Bacteroidota bacterium]|nr:DUF5615 family PIN-like protein [Bacteroidota bacterium]